MWCLYSSSIEVYAIIIRLHRKSSYCIIESLEWIEFNVYTKEKCSYRVYDNQIKRIWDLGIMYFRRKRALDCQEILYSIIPTLKVLFSTQNTLSSHQCFHTNIIERDCLPVNQSESATHINTSFLDMFIFIDI